MFEALLVFGLFVQLASGSSSASANTSVLSSRDSSGGWGWGGGGSGNGGNNGLQSFFDIALTALAFLSFGIFLLNLLLNALLFTTGNTGLTSTGPIITVTNPTNTAGTGAGGVTTGTGTGAGRAGRRKRRSTLTLEIDPTIGANILALRIIEAIDSMVQKHECLPKLLCETNKQARVIEHGFQYIMPFYSFSSSYVGAKLGLHDELLDHLDAILLGVNEENCKAHFPACK